MIALPLSHEMSRAQGFARGDFDTSFPIDDKFQDLRHTLEPARYYAASGVYWHVVAAAWRGNERKPASRVCPDAAAEIVDLVGVKLLDGDERLPKRAFSAYIGRANRKRAATSGRQRQRRTGMSRVTERDTRVTNAVSQTSRATGPGKDGPVGSGNGGGPGEDAPPLTLAIDYIEQRSGRPWHSRPGSRLYDTLAADIRDFGDRWHLAAKAVSGERPDHGQLIFGASNRLHPIEKSSSKAAASGGHTRTAQEVEDAFNN